VPGLASTTAADLARRLAPAQWQALALDIDEGALNVYDVSGEDRAEALGFGLCGGNAGWLLADRLALSRLR
jgi:hypothetical protein